MCNLSLVSTKKRINIYINLIIKTIIITILILWESFPARVCVLVLVCVFPAGSRGLLKLSQPGRCWKPGKCWQAGRSWERCRRRSGVGGSSLLRMSTGQRRQHLTIHIENVIISVTMITKMLFVTRPSNLRCKAFLPLGI